MKFVLFSSVSLAFFLSLSTTKALTWSATDLASINGTPNLNLDTLAYGNGVFLLGGESLFSSDVFAYRSEDGETWALLEGFDDLNQFRFVNGEFWQIANVRDGVGLAKSPDGLSWTPVPLPDADGFDTAWNDIAYGDAGYVIVGRFNIIHSADGQTWQNVFDGVSYDITWVDWAGDRYFAGAPGPATGGAPLLTSLDGITWTEVTDPAFIALRTFGAASGNDLYGVGAVFPGFESTPVYSQNSSSWTAAPNINVRSPREFLYAGDLFFALGRNVASSTDMQSFTIEPVPEAVGAASILATAGVQAENKIYVLVDRGVSTYSMASAELGTTPPEEPYLIDGAVELGDEWYFTQWLGMFNVSQWPWVYSDTFSWLYAGTPSNTLSNNWFYILQPQLNGWFYFTVNSPRWMYGQPVDQPESWWYIFFGEGSGSFVLSNSDGDVVISD